MTKHYQNVMFTKQVRQKQAENGSSDAYAHGLDEAIEPDILGEDEKAFIECRDSFYMATVSETGWPYVQHRGGFPGFLQVIAPQMLAMADYRGNRQYVSLGNLEQNQRASLFLMDYPRQARLKLLCHVSVHGIDEAPELINRLANPNYKAKIERIFQFRLEAFDWNCPQHITPRYTQEDIRTVTSRLTSRIAELEAQLAEFAPNRGDETGG